MIKEELKMGVIEKSYNGLLVVKAKNGNFNAGFDGNPRTLPNGTIFATDKALKYCIREYLATFGNKDKNEDLIFVRRNRYMKNFSNADSKKILYAYDTLEENYENKIKKYNLEKEKIWEDENIMNILKKFLDIRLFGIVFSPKGKGKNISLTGPVQISYGINQLENSALYSSQILSPYRNEKEIKNPEKKEDIKEVTNTTIGEETRADEVYYVYNISINSANAKQTGMTSEDLKSLKRALLNSVGPITSCTKYGCESVALVWLNNEKNIILNNLSDWVLVKRNGNNKIELNIKDLEDNLEKYNFTGIKKEEYSIDYDGSEDENSKNKIQVIYHKGKIEISNE